MPLFVLVLTLALAGAKAEAADWPQFMRDAAHTGNAADESLGESLGLTAQVQLGDAILTSPAVVGGKAYVVDQMGTAYCVDPVKGQVLWEARPDGDKATGGNSSTPCVIRGRVYYGTTAGAFQVLDAESGKVVHTVRLGWPVTGSPTFANDSLYIQTLAGVVHCLDRDGRERWRYEHYKSYQDPKTDKRSQGFPGSFHDPHYGDGEVAVAGKKVVVNLGWDLFCLEDEGKSAKLGWCNRAVLGKDGGIPMGPAVSDEWVYAGYPGTDRICNFVRCRLADGSFDPKKDVVSSNYTGFNWAILNTPAVRGATAFVPTHYMGPYAYDFGERKTLWNARKDNTHDQRQFTPCIGSPALAKDHCVFGTLFGDLWVMPLESRGAWPDFKPAPYRFTTASGKPIGSSPVVADGKVYFGCDDGCLYVLAPGGQLAPRKDTAKLAEARSRVTPATGKAYGAPVASMDQANTGCVDDPRLKPPLRLRWAVRPQDVRPQISADKDSLYFISEAGTLAAFEQATGRLRWRRRLLGTGDDGWKQILLDEGVLFVTRASDTKKPQNDGAALSAVDARSGDTLWEVPWGGPVQHTCRTAPVKVGNVVAAVHMDGDPPRPVVRAFDAATGKPLWKHELEGDYKKGAAAGGCVLDGVMFFSSGQTWGNGAGQTLAVEPATGKVLWSSGEYHIHGYGRPAGRDGKLFLGGQAGAPLSCVSAKDGKLVWKTENVSFSHSPVLGEEFLIVRGYAGHGSVFELNTGKPFRLDGKEVEGGCPDHACSPVLLTTGKISYAVSTTGLYARDMSTGKVAWQSLGFAPRTCTSPVAANGRLFFSPNVNNMLYCFEPADSEK
jgi:outer membrane protein assembly factor BamB